MTEYYPELTELVVSYRNTMDKKTRKPFSLRKISTLLNEEHNIKVNHNTIKKTLEDVEIMKRDERNMKRRIGYEG